MDTQDKDNRKNKLVTHDAIIGIAKADPVELVKFVNETIGTKYDPHTAIVDFDSNDLKALINTDGDITGKMGADLRRDLPFSINGDKFLLEVQTQHDKTILFRLVEYKLHGLLQSLANKNLDNQHEITIHLPQEILIQVEKSTAPAEYTVKYVANNQELIQKIPVIKLWEQDVQSLASGGKALLLPFLLNKFKQEFAKRPSDEQIGRRFIEEIKTIADKIYRLFQEEKISGKAAVQMQQAHKAMILGIKNEYIAKDNPAREELENMLNVSQEPFVSAWDQAIEQGKDMMRPTIEAMQQAMQKKLQKEQQAMQKKLQKEQQAMQKKLQKEQQARQKEQQARQKEQQARQKEQQAMQNDNQIMQAEIDRLKAQLAQLQKE